MTRLDPTEGSEIRKTRPCVVISPARLSHHDIFIVAPLSSGDPAARFRVEITFQGKDGRILPDQIRTVARSRLIRRMGEIETSALSETLAILRLMFEE